LSLLFHNNLLALHNNNAFSPLSFAGLEPNIPKLCDDSSKDTKAGEKSIKKDNKTAKDKK
jgi:hypothetical protein